MMLQKFLHSLKPTNDWHPVNDKNGYLARNKDNGSSLVQKLLFNIGLRREWIHAPSNHLVCYVKLAECCDSDYVVL